MKSIKLGKRNNFENGTFMAYASSCDSISTCLCGCSTKYARVSDFVASNFVIDIGGDASLSAVIC